jgi:hypothetical protein
MSIIYLTLALCLVQCTLYLAMWLLARRPAPSKIADSAE